MDETSPRDLWPSAIAGGGFAVSRALALLFPLVFLFQLYSFEQTPNAVRPGRDDGFTRFFGLWPPVTFGPGFVNERAASPDPRPAPKGERFAAGTRAGDDPPIVPRRTYPSAAAPKKGGPRVTFRPWQVVTALFLHSDFCSVLLSLLLLLLFGAALENYLGPIRFLLLFLACGAFGNFYTWHLFPRPPAAIVGPLPAFLGLLAAHAVLLPHRRISLFAVRLSARFTSALFAFLATFGYYVFGGKDPALFAALLAVPLGFLLTSWEGGLRPLLLRIAVARESRLFTNEVEIRKKLDEILRKIHDQGIENLSWRDRLFLKMMSRRYDDEPGGEEP